MRQIESQLQIACVKWFRLRYPKLERLFFAVPNGGARNAITGARMKSEGVRRGVADLILLIPRHGYASLCIEMKTAKGRQSQSQQEFQAMAEAMGNKYVVCRSFDQFKQLIEEYLKEYHG